MIDMHGCVLYVCEYVIWYGWFKGVGVITCMINPKTWDIWSLSYVRIMVPTYQNSDVLCWGVWAFSM